MAARYASARPSSGDGEAWSYGPAPGRSAPPAQRVASAAAPLPDLAEVARRLAASHFVCVAACLVCKPSTGAYDSHGTQAAADVRVLAVGYSAGSASTPELLKISSTPAFSLLRSWKTLLAGAQPTPRGVGPLRVTRRWLLADLCEVQLGPPGGGFLMRFRGTNRDACFVPLHHEGGGDAAHALLSACARAAAATGARLPGGTLAALAGRAGREAATSAPGDGGAGPLPWGSSSTSSALMNTRRVAAPPASPVRPDGYAPRYAPQQPSAPPRGAADLLAVRLAERADALEAELGGAVPADVIAEHLAAEALLRGEFDALEGSGGAPMQPASPGSATARAAAAQQAQQAAWQAASRDGRGAPVPVYTAQAPRATSAGDWGDWEEVPPEAMAPPPLARPRPAPHSVAAASPAAEDADALVERLAAEACLLRAALDGGADMRSPAVLRAARACIDGCAALRRLIAGHFGSAHWTPGGGLLGQAPPAQGRAALWVALHGDISALLEQTGHAGDAASGSAPGVRATPGWSEPAASSSDDDDGGASSSDGDDGDHWHAPRPPVQQAPSMAPLIDLSDAPVAPPPPPARPPPPPPPRPAPPPPQQQPASPPQPASPQLGSLQRTSSAGSASANGCCVCMERPIEAALLTCGHCVVCMQCAGALVAAQAGCPCCRSPIERVARIYI